MNDNKNLKRVLLKLDNEYCMQTPYACTNDLSYTEQRPVTYSGKIPITYALRKGGIVLDSSTQTNNIKMANSQLPFAVLQTESATGQGGTARVEAPSYLPNVKQLRVGLANTDTETAEVVLFDGMGFVAQKLKLDSVFPATIDVSGTWGADTVANLKTIGGLMPVDLHKIWMQNTTLLGAASTLFFDDGAILESYADIAGNSFYDEPLPVTTLLTDQSYQPNIRIFDGFRFLVNGLAALHLVIPAQTKVNIVLNISSVALASNMVKADGSTGTKTVYM